MASSRLEKIGTIFTRVEGILKAGGIKYKERPIWYDVYKAFPPEVEPRYARPVPNIPIRDIFYKEDEIRAQFHKNNKMLPGYNLYDNTHSTTTQRFIALYNKLKDEGALDEQQIYDTAAEMLENEMSAYKEEMAAKREENTAKREESITKREERHSHEKFVRSQKGEDVNINLKDIFK